MAVHFGLHNKTRLFRSVGTHTCSPRVAGERLNLPNREASGSEARFGEVAGLAFLEPLCSPTVDEIHFAPPQKPYDDSPVNTNPGVGVAGRGEGKKTS